MVSTLGGIALSARRAERQCRSVLRTVCDVALVIGANDTTNPAARSGEGPLAGMPIIDVDQARSIIIVKRSLSVGYAGVDNDLFYMDKTMMLFGDGKQMMSELNTAVKES